MSDDVMAKLKKLQKKNDYTPKARVKGIFHNWSDGDNTIRLVGTPLEVRTHFIAPSPTTKNRGLCPNEAFVWNPNKPADKIQKSINCGDWDIETESPTDVQSCPVCKLFNSAKEAIRMAKANGVVLEPEVVTQLDWIKATCRPRSALRWNVIDRKDPYIIEVGADGAEKKVKGYKIASIGTELLKSILGIFEQIGCEASDPEKGIDIVVTKTKGARTNYTARAAFKNKTLHETPLTEEERAMQLHDLKEFFDKQTEPALIVKSLHSDLRNMLESYENSLGEEETETKVAAPSPVAAKVSKALLSNLGDDDDENLPFGDDDEKKS